MSLILKTYLKQGIYFDLHLRWIGKTLTTMIDRQSPIFFIFYQMSFLVLYYKYNNFCHSYNTLSPFWSQTSLIPKIWLMILKIDCDTLPLRKALKQSDVTEISHVRGASQIFLNMGNSPPEQTTLWMLFFSRISHHDKST